MQLMNSLNQRLDRGLIQSCCVISHDISIDMPIIHTHQIFPGDGQQTAGKLNVKAIL